MCCNVPVDNFQHSDTLTILPTGASSMTDGGAANFGAAQYPGRYSNFIFDNNLFTLMCKMNNVVPLILHPFHEKGKMLCCTGHLD